MRGQPGAAHVPVGPTRRAFAKMPYRVAHGPNIRIVRCTPAASIVKGFGGDRTCFGQITQKAQQGLVQFGEVARFRRPVVHFSIDVDGVVAAPGWLQMVVPNTLQIGWNLGRT